MLTVALIAVGLLAALLALLLAGRVREIRKVRDLGERLEAVAQAGEFAVPLASEAGDGAAGEVAQSAERLVARLRSESAVQAERGALYRRLAEAMHEGVAVERDGIRLANARFAELCGAATPADLVGRNLTDLVHPDFSELVAGQLRRHRAGEPGPARLEVELPPRPAARPGSSWRWRPLPTRVRPRCWCRPSR